MMGSPMMMPPSMGMGMGGMMMQPPSSNSPVLVVVVIIVVVLVAGVLYYQNLKTQELKSIEATEATKAAADVAKATSEDQTQLGLAEVELQEKNIEATERENQAARTFASLDACNVEYTGIGTCKEESGHIYAICDGNMFGPNCETECNLARFKIYEKDKTGRGIMGGSCECPRDQKYSNTAWPLGCIEGSECQDGFRGSNCTDCEGGLKNIRVEGESNSCGECPEEFKFAGNDCGESSKKCRNGFLGEYCNQCPPPKRLSADGEVCQCPDEYKFKDTELCGVNLSSYKAYKNDGSLYTQEESNACLANHSGERCEFSDIDNCNNRGTVKADGNCECDDPTTTAGDKCQYTRAETCNGRGKPDDAGNCECEDLYVGKNCEIKGKECENDTELKEDGECDCGDFFTGSKCQYSYASCSGGQNKAEEGRKRASNVDAGGCTCKDGWTGPSCEWHPDVHCNGGTPKNLSTLDCVCKSGRKGDKCQYTNAHCNNRGTVDDNGNCSCSGGHGGKKCEHKNDCKNGGTKDDSGKCVCATEVGSPVSKGSKCEVPCGFPANKEYYRIDSTNGRKAYLSTKSIDDTYGKFCDHHWCDGWDSDSQKQGSWESRNKKKCPHSLKFNKRCWGKNCIGYCTCT